MDIPFSFFADENISSEIVTWLLANNFTTTSILSTKQFGISDRKIIEQCFSTKQIIITQDSDFGKLIYTEFVDFFAIIYLRPGHLSGSFHIPTLEKVFKHKELIVERTLIIATREKDIIKIRIKNIP